MYIYIIGTCIVPQESELMYVDEIYIVFNKPPLGFVIYFPSRQFYAFALCGL